MDTHSDGKEHESSAKRIKLDICESNIGVLCNGESLSSFSATSGGPIDISEGVLGDCDSGYEASTMESMPTPSHNRSPQTDPSDIQESLSSVSEYFQQTPSHTDNLDNSHDSIEEGDDDNASTVSHLSELSGLSDLSGQDWKPMAGSMIWIQKQMQNGVNPRTLLNELGVDLDQIPQYVDEVTLWKLIINMLSEPPRRNKLRHVNTLDDVVRLLKGAQHIIVLTGAGVSVSCGIPDFRSRDGIYSRLAIDFPDLPDPQAMFDISYFSQDPRPFFKFARDIYPGKFQPSPCHRFIKLLEKHNKLLRNYTQNIDTLEKVADIKKVIECHGSFATATCTKCGHKVTAEAIRDIVLAQKIPLCEKCQPGSVTSITTGDLSQKGDMSELRDIVSSGIMKPDIVFFGEGLPDLFHEAMAEDKSQCDLLLVIGSSLKVRPVALIPSSLPAHVPQILINREPLPHCHFDVELLGDCDVIVNHLCHLLGSSWEEGIYNQNMLKGTERLLPLNDVSKVIAEGNKDDEICNEVTEPNLSVKRQENICNCNFSTKSSSFLIEKDVKTICKCTLSYEKQMSIISKQSDVLNCDSEIVHSIDLKHTKERHMSVDSARDSGIGENSNFTDVDTLKFDENTEDIHLQSDMKSENENMSLVNEENLETDKFLDESNMSDMRGFWQPKVKRSLADRLPENSFYLIPPSRYIFPGAEVFYDPDEKFGTEHSSSSESSDTDSEEIENPLF